MEMKTQNKIKSSPIFTILTLGTLKYDYQPIAQIFLNSLGKKMY